MLVVFRIVGYNRALETWPPSVHHTLFNRAAHVVSEELSHLGHVTASPDVGLIVTLLTIQSEEVGAVAERVCMLLRRRVTLPEGVSGRYIWAYNTLELSSEMTDGQELLRPAADDLADRTAA